MPYLDHSLSELAEGPFVVTEATILHPDRWPPVVSLGITSKDQPKDGPIHLEVSHEHEVLSPRHWLAARAPESADPAWDSSSAISSYVALASSSALLILRALAYSCAV